MARGVPLPFGSVRDRRSLLFIGNLVAALFAALRSEAGDDTFFLSDAEDLSTPELIREIALALGRPARLLPVPSALLRAGDGQATGSLGWRAGLSRRRQWTASSAPSPSTRRS